MSTTTLHIATADLSGHALDWAVAAASDLLGEITQAINWVQLAHQRGGLPFTHGRVFSPSKDWSKAGPLIERESIALRHVPQYNYWLARVATSTGQTVQWHWFQFGDKNKPKQWKGETLLIAAMRCYVALKLGTVVEVPAALVDAIGSTA